MTPSDYIASCFLYHMVFFAIGYRPRPKEPAIDNSQSWPIFTLLVTQVKIVVIEPAKPISARCFR